MIDACQEAILRIKAESLMHRDLHAGPEGTYLIRSAYFDNVHDSCLLDSMYGTDPRSKFRIRYYDNDITRISLEKKSKCRGMTLKESCLIQLDECRAFLNGDNPQIEPNMSEEKRRLLTEIVERGLHPRCIVTYERIPYVYPGGNVRVTFDRKITSSKDVASFLRGVYHERPILPVGNSILEVKWDEVLPQFIKDGLSLENLQWTAFSKYYFCRMLHL